MPLVNSKYRTADDNDTIWDGTVGYFYSPWFIKVAWVLSVLATVVIVIGGMYALGLAKFEHRPDSQPIEDGEGRGNPAMLILLLVPLFIFWFLFTSLAKLLTRLQAKLTHGGQPVMMPKVVGFLDVVDSIRERMN